MEEFFLPPSTTDVSVIRDRTHRVLPPLYSEAKSVMDLDDRRHCDPNDPCCVIRDSEAFQAKPLFNPRLKCIPKNPFHFDYLIVHRKNVKNMLRMAAERQLNPDLTDQEYHAIVKQEADIVTTTHLVHTLRSVAEEAPSPEDYSRSTDLTGKSSSEYFEEHPEIVLPEPRLIDGDELKAMLEGLTNMSLAHEIALNKDFRLVKPERKESHLERRSPNEIALDEPSTAFEKSADFALDAKERYWHMVDHILLTKSYKEAKHTLIDLMSTLKTALKATILPHNFQLKLKIEEELNLARIEKDIDRHIFDLRHYMQLVLGTLASQCCPMHDQQILNIRRMELPSHQIRESINLMEIMNLDMANFVIQQSRKHIILSCGAYERNNFATYVETAYKNGRDPIALTRNWINRHKVPGRNFSLTMAFCFAELIGEKKIREIPETLILDWTKFPFLQSEILRITIIGSIIGSVYDHLHTFLLDSIKAEGLSDFEKAQMTTLKNLRLLGLLRGELDKVFSADDVQNPSDLAAGMRRCADVAVSVIDQHLSGETCEGVVPAEKEKIENIIMELLDPNHPSRREYRKIVKDWFVHYAKQDGHAKLQTPQTLQAIGPLIIVPVTEVLKIMMYNRGVFDVLYRQIYDGKCPPPVVYPPKQEKISTSRTVLDANKLNAEEDVESARVQMDEGIMNLVQKLRNVTGRTMAYKKSQIDPRIKPMFTADGTLIIPPELQADYEPQKRSELKQKHYDESLLANEPTLEEDYEGVISFNVGDPDWMFGYNTEQLTQLMERENLINANKLRRIKTRLEQAVLEDRVEQNLPIFHKTYREEVGNLQKEFCRFQRIMLKGPTPLPPGALDEPSGRRVFLGTCEVKSPVKAELPRFTKKGEPIIYSRRNLVFGVETAVSLRNDIDKDGMDLGRFKPDGEGDTDDFRKRGSARARQDLNSSYFTGNKKPDTPMQVLRRNIGIDIERQKTRKLTFPGLTIHVQKDLDKTLESPGRKFKRIPLNQFRKKPAPCQRANHYPITLPDDDTTMFDLPTHIPISQREIESGAAPFPLLKLKLYQDQIAAQPRQHHRFLHYHGPPLTKQEFTMRRQSIAFQQKQSTRRKSAVFGSIPSKDSLDSLIPLLGSLQEERERHEAIVQKQDRMSKPETAAPPASEDEYEGEEEYAEKTPSDDELISGKIRFDIPAPAEVDDEVFQNVSQNKKNTSDRVTKFSMNLKDTMLQANIARKMRVSKPRFDDHLPTANLERKESIKIQERRPTPTHAVSPGRMLAEHQFAMDQPRNHLFVDLDAPAGDFVPNDILSRTSRRIHQRGKTPELTEVAQELKKALPITAGMPARKTPPRISLPGTGDAAQLRKTIERLILDEDEDVEPGLIRIKMRKNLGRILTPPYSRNERSNSLTVQDFRKPLIPVPRKSNPIRRRTVNPRALKERIEEWGKI